MWKSGQNLESWKDFAQQSDIKFIYKDKLLLTCLMGKNKLPNSTDVQLTKMQSYSQQIEY